MTNIVDLLRGHSTKDSLDALYYAARFIKQAEDMSRDDKDFFDDDERSAPSEAARALTMRLIDAIETAEGKRAAKFDLPRVIEALQALTSAGELLDVEITEDEKAGAEKAIESMTAPSVCEGPPPFRAS